MLGFGLLLWLASSVETLLIEDNLTVILPLLQVRPHDSFVYTEEDYIFSLVPNPPPIPLLEDPGSCRDKLDLLETVCYLRRNMFQLTTLMNAQLSLLSPQHLQANALHRTEVDQDFFEFPLDNYSPDKQPAPCGGEFNCELMNNRSVKLSSSAWQEEVHFHHIDKRSIQKLVVEAVGGVSSGITKFVGLSIFSKEQRDLREDGHRVDEVNTGLAATFAGIHASNAKAIVELANAIAATKAKAEAYLLVAEERRSIRTAGVSELIHGMTVLTSSIFSAAVLADYLFAAVNCQRSPELFISGETLKNEIRLKKSKWRLRGMAPLELPDPTVRHLGMGHCSLMPTGILFRQGIPMTPIENEYQLVELYFQPALINKKLCTVKKPSERNLLVIDRRRTIVLEPVNMDSSCLVLGACKMQSFRRLASADENCIIQTLEQPKVLSPHCSVHCVPTLTPLIYRDGTNTVVVGSATPANITLASFVGKHGIASDDELLMTKINISCADSLLVNGTVIYYSDLASCHNTSNATEVHVVSNVVADTADDGTVALKFEYKYSLLFTICKSTGDFFHGLSIIKMILFVIVTLYVLYVWRSHNKLMGIAESYFLDKM